MKAKYKIEIYRSGVFFKDWRWRITSVNNGKIVGASSEGFKNRLDCNRNMLLVKNALNQLQEYSDTLVTNE